MPIRGGQYDVFIKTKSELQPHGKQRVDDDKTVTLDGEDNWLMEARRKTSHIPFDKCEIKLRPASKSGAAGVKKLEACL